MRVLHIGKFYPPYAGGIENFLADLVPAQQAAGDQIAVLAHEHREWRLWPTIAPETRQPDIYRAPCYGRLLYAPVSPQFPFWLAGAIRQFQPDILHLHVPNTSAFFALWLPAARRLPWVIHWHSDVVASRLDLRLALMYPLYRPFEQALSRRARAIITTSPPYLESSAALQPWRGKCQAIPLGLAESRLAQPTAEALAWAQAQWGETPGLRVLSTGRLTYYKGHEILIRAAAATPGLRVLIVGKGERREILRQQIQSSGAAQRVCLVGGCSDQQLAALLHTCDAFCLPSLERTEAFGMALLEAMRYGKPLIVSDIPGSGAGWVARQGGLLVKPGEVEELAAALRKLADNPPLRQELGQAGRRRFEQEFQIGRVAREIQQVYKYL
jgi:rhamnosyl/mannosyltransferase